MRNSFNGDQSINLFKQGMDFDSHIMDIENTSYLYGSNIRIVVNENSGNGILQAVDGLVKLDSSIKFKKNGSEIEYEFKEPDYKIIGVGVIRNYACIFTKNTQEPTKNAIFRLKLINDVIDLTLIVENYFNINNTEDKDLSISTRWEDFDNIKIYWADGINSLRFINIAENADETNLDKEVKFFENGSTTIAYKPEINQFKSGNLDVGLIQYAYQLFTVNGAESNISPLSDLVHLTKSTFNSVNYEGSNTGENSGKTISIKFQIGDESFDKVRIYSIHYTDSGQLPTVKIVSEFNLNLKYESDNYYQYFTDPGSFLSEISYEEFVGINPYYFIPKVIESKDDRLFASNIIEDNWTLADYGENGWYDTRAFRFAQNPEHGLHSRLISSSENEKIIKINHLDKTSYSDIEWSNFLPEDHDCMNPFNQNLVENVTKDLTQYEFHPDDLTIKGGKGRNVEFKIIHTKFGEDWYSTDTSSPETFKSNRLNVYNMNSRKVDIKNKMTLLNSLYSPKESLDVYYNIPEIGTTEYDNGIDQIEIQSDAFDTNSLNYSNPFIDTKFRSYQRDELYRFGVVFYDEKGRSTPAYWISDIRMPAMTENEHRLFDQWGRIKRSSTQHDIFQVVTYPMGLQFAFKDLPSDVKQIEIVRAERGFLDRSIVSQGIISKNIKEKNSTGIGITRPLTSMTYANSYGQILRTASDDDSERWLSTDYTEFLPTEERSNIPYIFSSSEISHFNDQIEDRFSGSLYLNILYGLSSPTKPDFVNFNDTITESYNNSVFVYNSQFWFTNGEDNVFWTSASDDNIGQLGMDGTSWMYWRGDDPKNDALQLFNTCYNRQRGSRPESKVRLIGKLYNPFTWYTTENSLYNTKDKNINIEIQNYKIADLVPFDAIATADEDLSGYRQNIGSDIYQNWIADRKFNQEYDERNRKTKHGPHGPALIFKSSDLYSTVPSLYRIGSSFDGSVTTDYSGYFGNKNFIITGNNSSAQNGYLTLNRKSRAYTLNSTLLCNIKRSTTPYGGLDYSSRNDTTYISTGSVLNLNETDTSVLNTFGGDTYIGLNEYMVQHWYYLANDPGDSNSGDRGQKAQIIVYYPSESSINLSLVHGSNFFRYSNEQEYPYDIQIDPGVMFSGFSQEKALYSYNSVYSSENIAKHHISQSIYAETNKNIDYRTIYSESKTNDEISDSWLKFKPANYLDVDTRFGSINNLKTFNNTLYFWQNDSFGTFSVNPRSLITDNEESALLLGKGDVLSNYSYITNQNGSKPNVINNTCISANSLYWYDHDRAELLRLSDNLESISKTKKIQSYFNRNKYNIQDSIKTLFNKKYNEVHYKFNLNDEEDDHLIFNEQTDTFTSFYSYKPDWFIDLKDKVYSINNNIIYKHNESDILNNFYDGQESSIFKNAVNDNYIHTKVFDNVEFTGDFDNLFTSIYFNTKTQQSDIITKDNIDLREDNYRFAISRNSTVKITDSEITPVFKDRMRGKYLIGTYTFTPVETDKLFKLPYIKTSYRISNI